MPKPSGSPGAGEEAAEQLLNGVEVTSLSVADVIAAIEALVSRRSVDAANALSRIEAPKEAAKAARRGLFRLQTQGIKPTASAAAAAEEPVPRASVARIRLLDARISSYDPRGTRAISILAEKPFTGLVSFFVVASDTEGLLDAQLMTTSKKAHYARLENFKREYVFIDFVPVDADYANQVVHKCAALNEHSHQALPQDFTMWRSFGAEPPEPPLPPPILSELSADDVVARVQLASTKDLAETEFQAWLYESDRLKEFLTRLDTALGGPLVLSQDAQKGRTQTIIDEAADAIFQGDELERARERLQETSHLLFAQGKREASELCLRAALAVGQGPAHEHPLLRQLMANSFEEIAHPTHDHDHGHSHAHTHEPEARTESGLILPA